MERYNKIIYALLISILLCICLSYGSDPGKVWPEKLEISVGETRNISCTMNPESFPNLNASNLYFHDNTDNVDLPRDHITIINETTIVYTLANATDQRKQYTCRCNDQSISIIKVYVGTPPKPTEDFKCRSHNWEYIVCNFTQPKNSVLTICKLTFNDTQDYEYQMNCDYQSKPLIVCNSTDIRNKERLTFQLKLSNALGENVQQFQLNLLDVVVPATPALPDVSETENGLDVYLNMPNYDSFKSLFRWNIVLQPMNMTPILYDNLKVTGKDNRVHFSLGKLEYGNYSYELRVRAKVQAGHDDEDAWSPPFRYTFWSKPRLPRAPNTIVGGFYVSSYSEQVRVYWEQLQPYEYNGNQFTYEIEELLRQDPGIQLQNENNSAIFNSKENCRYEFVIYSRNHLGRSLIGKHINVYPLNNSADEYNPQSIHNAYHARDRTYTLTWEPPANGAFVRNYTVFWCNSKTALQECKDSIHFKTVGGHVHSFTTDSQSPEQEHTLNLAVAAIYDGYNTGMHWAPCTADVDSDLPKMDPEVESINSTSLRVKWTSENICVSILQGYNLTYCEVVDTPTPTPATSASPSPTNDDSRVTASCVDGTLSPVININKDSKRFDIVELKPYTRYKVEMFMYSESKIGSRSDARIVRTSEAAPSPPRQLELIDTTSTTAIISWLRPSNPNGRIRRYTINYNGKSLKHVIAEGDSSDRVNYTLTNLASFQTYKVNVTAHTIESSEFSNNITFTTRIGYPSMNCNSVTFDKNNENILEWSEPTLPAGRVEYYEVNVVLYNNRNEVRENRTSAVIEPKSCKLIPTDCANEEIRTEIHVRAINAAAMSEVGKDYKNDDHRNNNYNNYANDNDLCIGGDSSEMKLREYNNASLYRLYKSEWCTARQHLCVTSPVPIYVKLVVISIIPLIFLLWVLLIGCKKYKKMADIACTLPAGLSPYNAKDGFPVSSPDRSEVPPSPIKDIKEYIFHNESLRLLGSVGNDSGYLGEGRILANIDRNTGAFTNALGCVDYTRSHSESSADSVVESNSSNMAAMGEANVNTNVEEADNATLAEDDKVVENVHNKHHHQSPIAPIPMINSEYVTVESLMDMGGYVQAADLQKMHSNVGISGYVTQRELNAFGQMQNFN